MATAWLIETGCPLSCLMFRFALSALLETSSSETLPSLATHAVILRSLFAGRAVGSQHRLPRFRM
jgi:hypothetical protein